MLIDDLELELNDYVIREIRKDHYLELFQLYKSNPYYFSKIQDHEIRYEECINDLIEIPPNTRRNQKQYIGFFHDGKLCRNVLAQRCLIPRSERPSVTGFHQSQESNARRPTEQI